MNQEPLNIYGDVDELEHNPFFAALQAEFKRDFENTVQVNGAIVCVPRAQTLRLDKGQVTDRKLVANHLFRPSPYFKGQYVTSLAPYNKASSNKVIEICDKEILKISGFPDLSSVKIIQEELGYNRNGKSYKILLIERPLESVKEKSPEGDSGKHVTKANIANYTLDGMAPTTPAQCEIILRQFDDGKVLGNLDVKVLLFNQNYLLLPQYVDDAAKKLKSIVDTTLKEIFKEDSLLDTRATMTVHMAIENYVMVTVNPKVFPVICQRFNADDAILSKKLLALRQLNVSATQLGADPLFSCPLPATVVELATLDSLTTPRLKLQCLKNVTDLIMAEIKQNLQEAQGVLTPPGGMPFLTSDNLIPVLLTAMVCAQLQHLASNLYYAENFVWSVSSKDAHSYSLVTFKAAVGFLKMLDIDKLKLKSDTTTTKKEITLAELMQVTENLEGKTIRSEDDDANTQWTPVDRQMERIARMIEASTRELTAVQHQGVKPDTGYYKSEH